MIRDYLRYRAGKKRAQKLLERNAKEIIKGFILDSRLLEAQQISTLLGLPEVTEDDVVASERRAKKVEYLLPMVTFLASSLSSGVMTYYDTVSPIQNELTEEERLLMEVWVAKVAVSCTLGVLSQFDELELIKVAQ